jgi:hypothetical protein
MTVATGPIPVLRAHFAGIGNGILFLLSLAEAVGRAPRAI